MSVLYDMYPDKRFKDLTLEQRRCYDAEWRRRNPDKVKASYQRSRPKWNATRRMRERVDPIYRATRRSYERQWRHANRDKAADTYRRYQVKKKYGLSNEELAAMFARQGGLCAICGSKKSKNHHDRLVIDHDHVTGRVRGILCDRCNIVLGMAKDSVRLLLKMVAYLKAFESQETCNVQPLFSQD